MLQSWLRISFREQETCSSAMTNVLQFTHYWGERKMSKIFRGTHLPRFNAFCFLFMFQYRFNQVLQKLNMMNWVWETSLGLLQIPTLRAASKCLKQLSTARAQSCEHRAGWCALCMGPAIMGTVTVGLHRLGNLTASGTSTGSSLAHEATQTIAHRAWLNICRL